MVYAFWPSLLLSTIFGIVMIVIQFIIPLIILVYCYGRIVWILTRRIDSNLQASNMLTESFFWPGKILLKPFY